MSQSVFKSSDHRKKFRDCYGNVLGHLPYCGHAVLNALPYIIPFLEKESRYYTPAGA